MTTMNSEPPPPEFDDCWPFEYDLELYGYPVYEDCEYRCDAGWLPLPEGGAIRCPYCPARSH